MIYSSYYNQTFRDNDELEEFAKTKMLENLSKEYDTDKLILGAPYWHHAGERFCYTERIYYETYRLTCACCYDGKVFNKTLSITVRAI